jgi:hypothetical protein
MASHRARWALEFILRNPSALHFSLPRREKEEKAVGIGPVLDRKPRVGFVPEGLLPIGLEEMRPPDVTRGARQELAD